MRDGDGEGVGRVKEGEGSVDAPGHGRRMSASMRPGEKSSDQSRVTLPCEQQRGSGRAVERARRRGEWARRREPRTDLAADTCDISEADGLKAPMREGGCMV
jgi:hypothetical protein